MQLISVKDAKKKETIDIALGIDLGTTNSLIAIYENGINKIIEDKDHSFSTKSIVAYDINGNINVGDEIDYDKNNIIINSVKRLVGKNKNDIDDENIISIIDQKDDSIKYNVFDDKITPTEVSAEILKKLKSIAEQYLKSKIEYIVLTVPAYFDERARAATKYAANLAGFKVLRLINEPTAAALAYGFDKKSEGIYLIYDLGGGTFDISILKMNKGIFQVLASSGDNMLGGDDIDKLLLDKFTKDIVNIKIDNKLYNYLMPKFRSLKEELSYKDSAELDLIISGKSYNFIMSKDEFNDLIAPVIDRTINLINDLIDDIDIDKLEIDQIILVGGSTRIPQISQKLEKLFNKKPLINIDPDKVVALGASLQAANLTGKLSNLLIDVLPLSLGIEVAHGVVEKIIDRNTSIPISIERKFTTQIDNQSGINFHIVQGEREFAKDCRSLARFELKNISRKKAGQAIISVTFTVDADGLLTVSAKDSENDEEKIVEVKYSYDLSERQIDSMIKNSIDNAKKDIDGKNLVECREQVIFLSKKIEESFIDKDLLSIEEIEKYEKQINSIKHESNEIEYIYSKKTDLDKIYQHISEKRLNKYLENIKGKNVNDI